MGKTKLYSDDIWMGDVQSDIFKGGPEYELNTKPVEFGFTLGVGITFPLSSKSLFIEGYYYRGLTNIYDEENADTNQIKNIGFQIKFGFLFSLNK